MSDDESTMDPIQLPVHELRPKGTAEIKLVVDNTGPMCWHHVKIVDNNRRKVTCGTCGAELDPFQCLHEVAREHERLGRDWQHIREEIRASESRLQVLKTLEDNGRARCKRLDVNASRAHVDRIIAFARKHGSRMREDWLRQQIADLNPEERLHVGLKLLAEGDKEAALIEFERAASEIVAALQTLEATNA